MRKSTVGAFGRMVQKWQEKNHCLLGVEIVGQSMSDKLKKDTADAMNM